MTTQPIIKMPPTWQIVHRFETSLAPNHRNSLQWHTFINLIGTDLGDKSVTLPALLSSFSMASLSVALSGQIFGFSIVAMMKKYSRQFVETTSNVNRLIALAFKASDHHVTPRYWLPPWDRFNAKLLTVYQSEPRLYRPAWEALYADFATEFAYDYQPHEYLALSWRVATRAAAVHADNAQDFYEQAIASMDDHFFALNHALAQ